MVRYGAAQEKGLLARVGMLGMSRDHGDSSGDIVSASRKIITELCTEYFSPPRWYHGPEAKLNESLLQRITDNIELIVSDAASNEWLAGDIGRGRRDPKLESSRAEGAGLLTPNLLTVGRDSAHSFRRTVVCLRC